MKTSLFIFSFFLAAVFFISCDKSETTNLETENSAEISISNHPLDLQILPVEDFELKESKEDPRDCCIDCEAIVRVHLPDPNMYDLWISGVCPNGDPGPIIGHFNQINTPDGLISFTMQDEQMYQFTALSTQGALVIDVIDYFGSNTLTIGDMVFPQPPPPVPPVSNNIYQYDKLHCNNYTVSTCYVNGVRVCCWAVQ